MASDQEKELAVPTSKLSDLRMVRPGTGFGMSFAFLIPMELFYIRSHFPTPKLELASYQLHVDGAVRNPFSLSYNELRDMPSETRVATLECAGNSRVFLIPQAEGAQWELRSEE